MRTHQLGLAVLLVACGLVAQAPTPGPSLTAERLTCEHRENPEGIATTRPRLSWRLKARDPAERQVFLGAYQVVAAGNAEALSTGTPDLWDTGIVKRSTAANAAPLPTRVEYSGRPLTSRDRVWWRVRVWDQDGRDGGWSTLASFSVGLLEQDDWKGTWIGLDEAPSPPLTAAVREELRQRPWIRVSGGPQRHERIAFFRRELDLVAAPVTDAWLAGTADMIADVRVNGSSVGQVARWELVKPISVAAALVPGRNAIGIRVENHDGFNPAVTGMLVLRFASGDERRVPFDASWKLAEVATAGWDRTGFDDAAWKPVEESAGQPWGSNRNTEHFMPPAPYLRTTFTPAGDAAGKTIRCATLYATALGLYTCWLNGTRVGSDEFTPGWTEYAKRVEHQTYDVTALVTPGRNCLGAVLGDGWYAGLMGYTGRRRFYDGPARFMAQLEIQYADGTRDTVATDESWQASFGPIRHTDNYMGSDYDSRLEMPGWSTPAFDATAWRRAESGLARAHAMRTSDVTAIVAGAVKDRHVSLLVGPAVLGDPAYGVVKTLTVDYTVGGVSATVALREGARLDLPPRGESGDLTITRAIFGEPPQPPPPPFVVEPQAGEPVRRFEELPAVAVQQPRPGRFVFDLGQNMVGWARLEVAGVAGQRLVVRHAEMLNPDGTLYTSNLRGATATDSFTLKGGPETLEPPFTFHGFRYVEITGLTAKPPLGMVTGIVAHTAMTPAGTFTCSSPLVNQLVHNIVWGQKGNYFSVPTDCPQRDERLGWTGDAQFFVDTAAYSFDIASFMERWLKTLNQDAQFPDGTYAHVAPKVNEGGGSTAWGDAAIVCTSAIYMKYGDRRVISDNYTAMCRYMAWLDTKTKDGITHVGGFGDWLNLDDPTDKDIIDTAYRARLCRLMKKMAEVIDRSDDARTFSVAESQSESAFGTHFVAADGSLRNSGQTGYALAFAFSLIPEDLREKAAAHFAAAIAAKNGHLATGFIGTPCLLPALHEAGQAELATRLLLTETYPGWLYQVKLGATTMWERWDGWTPEKGFSDVGMNSFNHYAFGSVGDFLYRHVAGIANSDAGYSRILIAPTIPVAGLDHVSATYDSSAGTIASGWRVENVDTGGVSHRRFTFDITIPPNTTAEIRLPRPSPVAGSIPADITESGVSFDSRVPTHPDEAPGTRASIRVERMTPGSVRLWAASGTYHFVVNR